MSEQTPKQEVIMAGDERSVMSNPDVELANLLDESGLGLQDTVKEMAELMRDCKAKNTSEDRKLRLEMIKHSQALQWSKASLKNINIWIFVHPWADSKLQF